MHTKWNTKCEKNTGYFVQRDLKSHSDTNEDSVLLGHGKVPNGVTSQKNCIFSTSKIVPETLQSAGLSRVPVLLRVNSYQTKRTSELSVSFSSTNSKCTASDCQQD